MGRGLSPRDCGSAPVLFSDKNPSPISPTCPGTPNGRPLPHPCSARPSSPTGPGGYSHILGGQRPALHDADVQGAALGHGALPQTFRPGGRPGSEAGPRQGGRLHVTRRESGTLSRSPRATCPKRAGSWTGGFRRRREDSDRGGGASLPGLYR